MDTVIGGGHEAEYHVDLDHPAGADTQLELQLHRSQRTSALPPGMAFVTQSSVHDIGGGSTA